MAVPAGEVLILDSNIFINEIGLTSRGGSALKHFLSRRGMRLVVPEVVAEECERHLTAKAKGRRTSIEQNLQWLARFCGRVRQWQGPSDETIEERARALAKAEHLDAVVIRETPGVRGRAESRHQSELPPSHRGSELSDCRIWEQCMELLGRCHVVFVSGDRDFRGNRQGDKLHPALRAEAEAIAEDRNWTFHRTMESLLEELRSEIQPIPDDVVFAFVYDSIASEIESSAFQGGYDPKRVGLVEQTLLTTDQPDVVEARLKVEDIWQSPDAERTIDFRFSGSCHYRVAEEAFSDLTTSEWELVTQLPDGSTHIVGVDRIRSPHFYDDVPQIKPEPAELGTWVSAD